MSSPRLLQLAWPVSVVLGAFALAVPTATAQTSVNSNQDSISALAASESSSASFLMASNSDLAGIASPAAVSGMGASGSSGHSSNWKEFVANHYAIELGAGFNAPVGNDLPYITWGGNFTVGGGLHLTDRISLLAEYQFIDDKLPGSLIAQVGTQGGNAHIWSLTLDPVIDLFPKRATSFYLTGGGGFYRKLTSFTDPEETEVCTFYCGIVEQNATVYHFSSNQGGANLGFGITHRLGGMYHDSKTQLFAEARYLFVNTPSITANNGLGSTELIPVSFGVRW